LNENFFCLNKKFLFFLLISVFRKKQEEKDAIKKAKQELKTYKIEEELDQLENDNDMVGVLVNIVRT